MMREFNEKIVEIDVKKSLELAHEYRDCLEPQECYANAKTLAVGLNCDFVLGYIVVESERVPHAWLEQQGIHVDPTTIFFKNEKYKYIKCMDFSYQEVAKIETARISERWNECKDPSEF